jgi:DNA processing protein
MGQPTIYSTLVHKKEWPELLLEVPAKTRPKQLYASGSLPPADALIVAIVGTRHPTAYGKDAAYEIARTLAKKRIVIASGMALGIDSIAHRAALETGTPTIAVLGSGIDESVLYPKENVELAKQIVASGGALISEYKSDQKPELWTFPQRNRIIAGIAKAIVVIEAGEKSGALITARFATEYNRDVFALPGQMYSKQSKGTNALIKQGAQPITSCDDILNALGIEPSVQEQNSYDANPEEQKILDALDEELPIDEIIKRTSLRANLVIALTSSLEIRGIIKGIGGGIYRKI